MKTAITKCTIGYFQIIFIFYKQKTVRKFYHLIRKFIQNFEPIIEKAPSKIE